MMDAREALVGVLDAVTLQELAQQTLAGMQIDGVRPALMEVLLKPAARRKPKGSAEDPEYLI